MCDTKIAARTKLDRLIEGIERLIATLERQQQPQAKALYGDALGSVIKK